MSVLEVEKLITNIMDPDQTGGWSGSTLVANALCWFCHGILCCVSFVSFIKLPVKNILKKMVIPLEIN
jgi:hypothetical protein